MPEKRATGRSRTAASADPPEPAAGAPMTTAVTAHVVGLAIAAEDHRRRALGQLALTLAAQLDAGAGMATAAVSKELRATLTELEGEDTGDADDFAVWAGELGTSA